MPVTGFAGVLLFTSAERHAALAAFYRDVLRLPVRRDRPGFASFEWGDVRLTITVHDGVHGPARDPLRLMVNLTVDDLDAEHARLARAGVPVQRAPEHEDWGGWVATYEDPDSNVVQLFQLQGPASPAS
jgi:predicted enzyme related to lactoylglutathione lyase